MICCLHPLFVFLLALDVPAPFAINDNTTELIVTAPLDREERETYSPMLVCTVQTDTMIDKFFVTLHINVYDEDDNAPYVSGTDTEDVVLEFDRKQVTLLYHQTAYQFIAIHVSLIPLLFLLCVSQGSYFGNLVVYDRDTTPRYPKSQSQNRFVGNMMTNDSWINEMFAIEYSFKEEKAIFGNVRGTVHEFRE